MATALAQSDDSQGADSAVPRSKRRAAEAESALFAAHGRTVSLAYKERARALIFNLADTLNRSLRESLLSGALAAKDFVRMSPDELANPALQAANTALDMVATAELVRSNTGGCETEGLFQCPKCKGQKTRHFADHKPQGAKSETWGSGRGKDEDVASRTRVTCLNCKHEWRE